MRMRAEGLFFSLEDPAYVRTCTFEIYEEPLLGPG